MNKDQILPYFFLFFIIAIIWNIIAFGYLFYKRKKRGSIFPDVSENDIMFSEKTASGRSHKSIFTRYGGANNCLKIIITNEELWITSWFPFSLLIEKFDLEHRIKKDQITDIEQLKKMTKNSFIIHFKTDDNSEKTIELYPKDSNAFAQAIGYK